MKCVLRKISPTALSLFEHKPDRFIFYYVLTVPRAPQTQPMAVGSSFDVHVKSALIKDLLDQDSEEWFNSNYERSVEFVHRDWAKPIGAKLLESYRKSGSYKYLLKEMSKAKDIQMEFDAVGIVKYPDGFKVPIGGKPDLAFINRNGLPVILDWKVSGFMSKASPQPGYIRLMDESGFNYGAHKDIAPLRHKGMYVGRGRALSKDWCTQLTMYSWMLYAPEVEVVLGIDQITARNKKGRYHPDYEQTLKFSCYRSITKPEFKKSLQERLRIVWEAIQAEHYYHNMTKEESDARVNMLAGADDEMLWALNQTEKGGSHGTPLGQVCSTGTSQDAESKTQERER